VGAAVTDPVETARAFVDAIVWGDHNRVWELLAPVGRETVIKVAVDGGMERDLATRLREDAAGEAELNQFLSDLVGGLRADLAGNDLDNLSYETKAGGDDPAQAEIVLLAPMPAILGGTLPCGTLELNHDGAGWRVERLLPRSAK